MGILYSHMVFQQPKIPTYIDNNGTFRFRNVIQHTEPVNRRSINHPLIYLETSRGNSIPAAFFHRPGSHFTVLFSHGNAEDLGMVAPYCLKLSTAINASVLCYDYSGYGLADGTASEEDCYRDIQAAYRYLISERHIPPSRILLFGRSLGSGPTVDLACRLGPDLGGVVLISALASCVRVKFNCKWTMNFDMFANIDKINRVQVPVLCVHGMMDNVVPFKHGVELSRRAKYPIEPIWIKDAGHNNVESPRFLEDVFNRYATTLKYFIDWTPPVALQQVQGDRNRPPHSSNDQRPNIIRRLLNYRHRRHQQQQTPNSSTAQGANACPPCTTGGRSTNCRAYSATVLPQVNELLQTDRPSRTFLPEDTSMVPTLIPALTLESSPPSMCMLTNEEKARTEKNEKQLQGLVKTKISLDHDQQDNNFRKHTSSPPNVVTAMDPDRDCWDPVAAMPKAEGVSGGVDYTPKQEGGGNGNVDININNDGDDGLAFEKRNNNSSRLHKRVLNFLRRKFGLSLTDEDGGGGSQENRRQQPASARPGRGPIWRPRRKRRNVQQGPGLSHVATEASPSVGL